MYEVILYAAIATIVCVILYSVLGKSIGHGSEEGFDPTQLMNNTEARNIVQPVIDKNEMPGIAAIIKADNQFSKSQFIHGATAAYSMILEGFAEANRELLSELLTDEVYAVYDAAITEREAKGLTQITDLGRLMNCEITGAETSGKIGRIYVQYEAELTSALKNSDGDIVQGDPDILSRVSEIWTFERKLNSSDPNWRLSDVAPSTGDDLATDPSPDTQA